MSEDTQGEILDDIVSEQSDKTITKSASALANLDTLLDIGRGGIVSARGTADGLVIRLDARVDNSSLLEALNDFVEPRRSFLSGNPVTLEWVGDKPESAFADEVSQMLERSFQIVVSPAKPVQNKVDKVGEKIIDVELRSLSHSSLSQSSTHKDVSSASLKKADLKASSSAQPSVKSLFDGISELVQDDVHRQESHKSARNVIADPSAWDDANARIVYSTVRSGQRIESEHSLVIIGDVNPGSEVIAGGDIVVLGSLRGIAHAGAYDESGGGRVIFALNLQPTQLRIGTTISRGSAEGGKSPEVARVEGTNIVVEQFQARSAWFRRWA